MPAPFSAYELLPNAIKGLGVGAGGGALAALLQRKLTTDGGFSSPEERTSLPMIDRPAPPEKKKAKKPEKPEKSDSEEKSAGITDGLSLGHLGGAGLGATGSFKLLSALMNRKDTANFDAQLAEREKRLNDLLLQEQSMAAGIAPASMSVLNKAAEHSRLNESLEKIAAGIWDAIKTYAGKNWEHVRDFGGKHLPEDIPLSEIADEVKAEIGLNAPATALQKALMVLAGTGGAYYGLNRGIEGDENRAKIKAVKDSLKEKLTGKDDLMGPMPIRVETDEPSMRPIRPGATSLVDPTRGRDVLDGI